MSEADGTLSPAEGSSAKRKRGLDNDGKPAMSSRACIVCRTRKVRCCGKEPCERCTSDGVTCQYATPRKKGRPRAAVPMLDETALTRPHGAEAVVTLPSTAEVAPPPQTQLPVGPVTLQRRVIVELARLWFERLAIRLPIIDETSFMADLNLGRDRWDRNYLYLLLSLCAATAVRLAGEEMPAVLADSFSTWEDAGRWFNNALPRGRIREMFVERDVCVLQNIMLVATYEMAMGTPVALHLVCEAYKFALAHGYHRAVGAEQRLERTIFWTLYVWDKFSALAHDQPMSLRRDEVAIPQPADDVPVGGVPTSHTLLSKMVQLATAAEDLLLEFRRHAREQARLEPAAILADFRQASRTLLAVTTAPVGQTVSTDYDAISSFPALFQSFAALQLYTLYHRLVPSEVLVVTRSQIASSMIKRAIAMPTFVIDRLGPFSIDAIDRAAQVMREAALDDPFLAAEISSVLAEFDVKRPYFDCLRHTQVEVVNRVEFPLLAPTEPSSQNASPSDDFQAELRSWLSLMTEDPFPDTSTLVNPQDLNIFR